MTEVRQSDSVVLTSQWTDYSGGSNVDLDATPSVTIAPAAGGAAIVGPTTTGVGHPATGVYSYTWSPTPSVDVGNYVITWSGLYSSDAVTATEVVEVLPEAQDSYIALADFKSMLKITDTDRDDDLQEALYAGARSIDDFCHRRFYLDATATARSFAHKGRVFRESGSDVLIVPDIGDTTGLTVEVGRSSWTDITTSIDAEPLDAIVKGRPVTRLKYVGGSFPTGTDLIRVTVRWGWPSIPYPVLRANRILSTRYFKRKDSPEGVVGSAEWGAIRVSRMDPDVETLLGPFVNDGLA